MSAVSWDMEQAEEAAPDHMADALALEYVVPPFSVLDTRQGRWQERRRRWLALGIASEIGRGDLTGNGNALVDHGKGSAVRAFQGANNVSAAAAAAALSGGWEGHGSSGNGAARAFGEDLMRREKPREYTANGGVAEPPSSPGTSIFDPVLCELVYRWWCPPGGAILDPFAGGSVRGIVAARMGHPYTGIDLSERQVAANREQAASILSPGDPVPRWIVGDSARLEELLPPGERYDLVFSCPPYYDLEVYSDHPADLSAMGSFREFLAVFKAICNAAVARLRDDRFAAMVVSDVRDKRGIYHGLVPHTVAALSLAGAAYYNEAILVNSVGSLPLRVGQYMASSRKLGRTHQNVIVGIKGDPRASRGWGLERAAPADPQLGMF